MPRRREVPKRDIAADVADHLEPVGEADLGDLAQRGVRLLRRLGEHPDANAALLRAVLQRRALRLTDDLLASLANKLTDSRHSSFRIADSGLRILDGGTLRNPKSGFRNGYVSGLNAGAWHLKTLVSRDGLVVTRR